nr:hypothetical protein CFP56_64899 [Quercus suber]
MSVDIDAVLLGYGTVVVVSYDLLVVDPTPDDPAVVEDMLESVRVMVSHVVDSITVVGLDQVRDCRGAAVRRGGAGLRCGGRSLLDRRLGRSTPCRGDGDVSSLCSPTIRTGLIKSVSSHRAPVLAVTRPGRFLSAKIAFVMEGRTHRKQRPGRPESASIRNHTRSLHPVLFLSQHASSLSSPSTTASNKMHFQHSAAALAGAAMLASAAPTGVVEPASTGE